MVSDVVVAVDSVVASDETSVLVACVVSVGSDVEVVVESATTLAASVCVSVSSADREVAISVAVSGGNDEPTVSPTWASNPLPAASTAFSSTTDPSNADSRPTSP
ncbi:hypothetical protein SRABI106_03390 [Rahnella aquatilis]|nr:hypothetical protein SRABI106_03390 [Rahnella aquatilis]